jgi:ribonucleotide reductase alpha subunit
MSNTTNNNSQIFQDSFSEEVWRSTYKHHSDNDALDTNRRVAKAVASVEVTEELRKEWEEKFYDMLSDFKVTPGGRILSNAGTEFEGTTLLNCFVGPKPDYDQDSMEGIFKVLLWQAQTLKSEGGWGMNFSFIRPRGSFIRGIGVESPGAVKYMEIFDKVSDVITSGSGKTSSKKIAKGKIRKGAMMGSLAVWHGDIEEFIDAKQQQGRLTKFNISVQCTQDFMDLIVSLKDAVQRGDTEFVSINDKWNLEFPDTTHPLYKAKWDGNLSGWKSIGGTTVIFKTVSALGLWDKIIKSTYSRNDPGVLFTDIANKTHCWNYGQNSYIATTNPCLPAWAKVLTKEGVCELKDIDIGSQIWSSEGWTTIVNKWSTGIKKVFGYKTNSGTFYGTQNHRIVSNGVKVEVKDAKVIDIVDGPNVIKDSSIQPINKITSVDFISEEEVFDITVDNASHTFWNNGLNVSNCGEQNLPFGGACNLSSVNLTQFVNSDFSDYDYNKLATYVSIAVRFLDNVNSLTRTPLPQYQDSVEHRRRIGVGLMGWASSLYMLKVPFGSDKAEEVKAKVMEVFTKAAVNSSIDLAVEKGAFRDCDKEQHANAYFWKQINLPQETIEKIRSYGIRNSALFSIQPTGNTSILANIVSGGIEPVFSAEYIRTVIVPTCPESMISMVPKYWEGQFVETDTFKFAKEGDEQILRAEINGTVYKIDKNRGLTKEVLCEDYGVRQLKKVGQWDSSSDWAKTAMSLPVESHIKDMKGWAKWIDSAISKTVNVPEDYKYEDFENIYLNAYKTGYIKGLTTYRAGTMTSVLSAVEDKSKKKDDCSCGSSIHKTHAPKRQKYLPADIHHPILKGVKYYVAVGLMEGEPYEVFTGINASSDGETLFSKTLEKGEIVKHGGGRYGVKCPKGEEKPLTSIHNDSNADALTRMVSTALRHGTPIEFIVQQLEKTKGELTCFAKVLGRTLKKYIKEGQKVNGKKCEVCGGDLVYTEGCQRCISCSHSKCG